MAKFKEALNSGKFVVTAEVGPPKGTDITETLEHIDLIKDKVDGINSTDNQSSVMRISSLGTCALIKQRGGEPILQMTCRDRNRMGLESDLLAANVLGIDNVLCLTGDYISVGDHLDAKPVFDLDSVQLVQAVRLMEEGKDLGGNELNAPVKFCCGAIVTPEADPIEPQLIKLRKKLDAGVNFIQTQAVYNLDDLRRFTEFVHKVDAKVKILAGILPIIDLDMARNISETLPGVLLPQEMIDEILEIPPDEVESRGIELASNMIREIKQNKICHGVHIMLPGNEEKIPEILKAVSI